MTNDEVLQESRDTLDQLRGVLDTLESAPRVVRNKPEVQAAVLAAKRSRRLILELLHRVRNDINGGQDHGEQRPEAGAGVQALS